MCTFHSVNSVLSRCCLIIYCLYEGHWVRECPVGILGVRCIGVPVHRVCRYLKAVDLLWSRMGSASMQWWNPCVPVLQLWTFGLNVALSYLVCIFSLTSLLLGSTAVNMIEALLPGQWREWLCCPFFSRLATIFPEYRDRGNRSAHSALRQWGPGSTFYAEKYKSLNIPR